MGFRCSLLGHDYDEPTTEEEREERGNEVVVTVRELETCSRCGAETVISENTEVRSITAGVDAAGDGETDATADGDDGPATAAGEPATAEDGAATAEGGPTERVDDAGDVQSAAEDDGVILDDEDDSADRAAGEWPDDADAPAGEPAVADADGEDAEDAAGGAAGAESSGESAAEPADDPDLDRNGASGATDLTEWPDPGVEDEGFDARPSGDDDVDVEFGGGLRPEAASGEAEEGAEFVSASGTGITSTGPVERTDDVDTVLVCPECEFGAETGSTSQRPGDICPDCRRGYLTERER